MNESFTDDTPKVSTSFVLDHDRRRGRRASLHRVQGLHLTDPRAFATYERIEPASTHSDFFDYRIKGWEGDLFEDQNGRLLGLTSHGLFPMSRNEVMKKLRPENLLGYIRALFQNEPDEEGNTRTLAEVCEAAQCATSWVADEKEYVLLRQFIQAQERTLTQRTYALSLGPLEGSTTQTAWAESIRRRTCERLLTLKGELLEKIEEVSDEPSRKKVRAHVDAVCGEMFEHVTHHVEAARDWIDWRDRVEQLTWFSMLGLPFRPTCWDAGVSSLKARYDQLRDET